MRIVITLIICYIPHFGKIYFLIKVFSKRRIKEYDFIFEIAVSLCLHTTQVHPLKEETIIFIT